MHELFELDFSRWEIYFLFIGPALINLSLFIYSLFFLSSNRANYSFSLFVLVVGLWQLAEGLTRLNVTSEGASKWFAINSVFALFMTPFGLLFALDFFDWKSKVSQGVIFISQFIPAILASVVLLLGFEGDTVSASPDWYWVINTSPSIVNYAIYLWISVDGLLMLILLWGSWVKQRRVKENKKKYALVLAIGFTIPFLGGIIAEVAIPVFANASSIPITAGLFTFFSVACLIAIQYNMLDYSPKHQWDQIVKRMNEGILIIDNNDLIMYANHSFCEALGFTFDEIKGKPAGEFCLDLEPGGLQKILSGTSSVNCRLKLRNGEGKWMVASGSPYLNRKGVVIGTIGLFTNIDHLKKAEEIIRLEKEKLKLTIEAGKMATFEFNYEEKWARLSENAIRMLGVDPSMENTTAAINDYIHPDDREMVRIAMNNSLQGKVTDLQFRFDRPDTGERMWIERRGEIIRNSDGTITGMRGVLMDVTQGKLIENELFQSTAHLKAIYENEPECVKVVGITGDLIDMNPAGLAMIELENIDELSGIDLLTFIHPDDISIYYGLHDQVCKGKKGSADFRLIGKHGTERWMESNAVPLKDYKGNVYAVLSVSRDITEIKKKTDELRRLAEYLEKSEKGLRQAQSIAQMGNWETNLHTTEMHWSDEFYSILGLSKEQSHPSKALFVSLIHPDDRMRVQSQIDLGLAHKSDYSFVCRIIRTDGAERSIYADCRFDVTNGETHMMYGIIQDISKQKDIEQKLERSRVRLLQAQEIAHIGNWEINFHTNMSILSDEAYRIYGIEPGDHKFSIKKWLSFIHPDDLEYVHKEIAEAKRTLKGISMEHRIVRNDGTVRYVHSESRFEFDQAGKPAGLVGIVHDITERKSNEAKLQKLLEITNNQNKRLQNFTYIVSHNIRSHSSNISGLVDALSESIDNEEFHMLRSSSEKLAETIQNLNNVIAIQTELNKEYVSMNLKLEIEKTLYAINSMITQSNSHIIIDVPDDIFIDAIPSYLESILLNLLTNAIKYRQNGRDLTVRLTVAHEKQYVVLSVEDNGMGINLEKYGSSIFGLYKTFHNNPDSKGLGLFIVKSQIEAMNGHISVSSKLGQGTVFRVFFNCNDNS